MEEKPESKIPMPDDIEAEAQPEAEIEETDEQRRTRLANEDWLRDNEAKRRRFRKV
jgi:hypothetical protein